MTALLIAAIFAALGGAGYFAFRTRSPKALPAKDEAPNLFNLKPGHVVQHVGTDYVVERRLDYSSEGFTWHEYLLDAGDGSYTWLSVEEDDRLVVALVKEIDDLTLSGRPPREIEHEGIRYALEESGTAQVKMTGSQGQRTEHTAQFFDYAQGNDLLSIEDWGNEREVTLGRVVSPSTLTLLGGA